MVFKKKSKAIISGLHKNKSLLFAVLIFVTMCAPPVPEISADAAEEARLDSIRQVRCPRVFSSAAEFYKNRQAVF